MIVGVPKEIKEDEYRVGLTAHGAAVLVAAGHEVLLETQAGAGCRISDAEYEAVGVKLVSSASEIYARADMIIKVKEPLSQEYDLLRENQVLYAYLHLAPAAELTAALLAKRVIAIAYETIQLADGSLPLLVPMSEVAGRMAPQIGAHFLEITQGGRGVLLGGVPGVHRGKVTVIGAGVVGRAAAKIAIGMGADVWALDVDHGKLSYMDDVYENRITTLISNAQNIEEAVCRAHLVIGSVLIPGARAPHLVNRDMVRRMKAGAVIVDVAIDQGGCVETSRPTTHRRPVFTEYGVLHYCVPNMPGVVARTSTYALTNMTLPYAKLLADLGPVAAIRSDTPLSKGVNCYKGVVTYKGVAASLGYDYVPLGEVLGS